MLPSYLKELIESEDIRFAAVKGIFPAPDYDPLTHYVTLTKSPYFHALLVLRHYIKLATDYYFGMRMNAKNIDLFMITPSISSPMGSGSDSEPLPFKFGKYNSYLVDSSQFGFEPLIMNGFEKVYCYLPSMRGENPDNRHLNQFYHCEAEVKGNLNELMPIVEDYLKILCETILLMPNIVNKISKDPGVTMKASQTIVDASSFEKMKFDDSIRYLKQNGFSDFISFNKNGNDISAQGEILLLEKFSVGKPIWLTGYDRDRVPFYQKPDPENTNKVINADMIFPPLIKGSFGGEIIGAGQRQDLIQEIYESLSRQKVPAEKYEWYIDLRRQVGYSTTSGFGMGIERFLAWVLCRDNIRDVIIYPRLKNVVTFP